MMLSFTVLLFISQLIAAEQALHGPEDQVSHSPTDIVPLMETHELARVQLDKLLAPMMDEEAVTLMRIHERARLELDAKVMRLIDMENRADNRRQALILIEEIKAAMET